jgi:prepilin-type N-terminal cleavage/methylation domain-containing protein
MNRNSTLKIIGRGFTLIELLVVIAIISLLLSILLPGLRKAKETVKGIVCRSNLRQMPLAFSIYSQENDGRMFMMNYGAGYWLRMIAPYLDDKSFQENPTLDGGGVMKVSLCPATIIQTTEENAPDNKTTWRFNTGGNNGVIVGSYGINCWTLPDPDYYQYVRWGGSANNARGKFFDRYSLIRADTGLLVDAFRMDNWPEPEQESLPIKKSETQGMNKRMDHSPSFFMRRFTVDRHGWGVNVGFVGGYVERIKLENLGMIPWNQKASPVELRFERGK